MTIQDLFDLCNELKYSQGFYGRLLAQLEDMSDDQLAQVDSVIRNANLQIKDTSQIIKHEKGEADTTYNIDPYQISESYYDMLRNPLDYTEIDEDGVY